VSELIDILQSALAPGYTLERELTGGGMSRVFVATDVTLARKVVVKVLPPELAAGVNHERFRREIQVAAQLQHPHVVPLLSAGEQESLIWYTMPFINGESLREAVARGQHFSVKEVVRIMRDVAEALDYAHGLGVIHRDIKPGNVLLLGSHALVTDFGVAKAISASMPASGFTSAGMAIGTPAYMAPEQIAADPAADHRMDLYALGLLAYELLTGQAPFQEDSPQKTMAAQLTRDPSPVETTRDDVPAALSALVRHLLAKLPEERPQRASEVVHRLDEIADASGPSLAPVRPTRRPSALRTIAIAGVGVAVVAAAWVLGERTGAETGTALVRDSLIAAESTQMMASATSLLTRDDSMAIARAVSARMAERTPAKAPTTSRAGARSDSVALALFADSIRAQIQRAVLDSLVLRGSQVPVAAIVGAAGEAIGRAAEAAALSTAIATEAGAPRTAVRASGPRRVIVAQPRPSRSRPEMDAIVASLADSLRLALDAHPRYVVVPADSVARALAETRTVNALQERLDAELVISIALVPVGDTVTRIITVRDLGAGPGASTRVVMSKVTPGAPGAGMRELVPQVVRALTELERAARVRPPSEPRPPRP